MAWCVIYKPKGTVTRRYTGPGAEKRARAKCRQFNGLRDKTKPFEVRRRPDGGLGGRRHRPKRVRRPRGVKAWR